MLTTQTSLIYAPNYSLTKSHAPPKSQPAYSLQFQRLKRVLRKLTDKVKRNKRSRYRVSKILVWLTGPSLRLLRYSRPRQLLEARIPLFRSICNNSSQGLSAGKYKLAHTPSRLTIKEQ